MEAIRRADGRYAVFIPAKMSPPANGKLNISSTRPADRVTDRVPKSSSSSFRPIGVSMATVPSRGGGPLDQYRSRQTRQLSKFGEVLEHWRKTGANIKSISAREAVEEFIRWRLASNRLKPRTVEDIQSRLGRFAKYFGDTPFNQIGAEQIDKFLLTYKEGGSRRSYWKRISPMFEYGSSIKNWVAVNPLIRLTMSEWGKPKRGIYTPEQDSKLIAAAASTGDEIALRYLVLMGTGFLRFSELVGGKKSEVLKWEDIQIDRFINVRKEVAKGTRRAEGDARTIPLTKGESLHTWLYQQMDGKDLRDASSRSVTGNCATG